MFAALLIGACSAPEAPAPERPALRFAHNLWPGYFPITLARELGYYAQEGVAVEVTYTEDQEPQIADFIAGKYDGMALPIGSLIVASGHHPDLRVVYAITAVGACLFLLPVRACLTLRPDAGSAQWPRRSR